MRNQSHAKQYSDLIEELYAVPNSVQQCRPDSCAAHDHVACREITIQVTEDCNCACTYCYQIAKTKKVMSIETGRKIVDTLFNMWYANKDSGLINQENTKAVVLDFIGGEPLLNMPVVDDICSYFYERCLKENHPWAKTWCANFSTNGTLYFTEAFQNFLKKFDGRVSVGITVDGPKELHNACRLYKNSNQGCWDEAIAALKDYMSRYQEYPGTKVTLAPENLSELNTIANFFIDLGVSDIYANPVYEHAWTIEEAQEYYKQLKQLADTLLTTDKDIYCSLFQDNLFGEDTSDSNFCGGTGAMLAFNPDGIAYPCLRYMETSLGNERPALIIGDCTKGLFVTDEQKELKNKLDSITKTSQSTKECLECPIAAGCSWCSAWNYQETGSVNCRSTHICNMHKARSLANVYYWNSLYINNKGKLYSPMKRNLPDEEALKFISKDELKMLDTLYATAKEF